MTLRDERGRILPGQTLNPGGRQTTVSIVRALQERLKDNPHLIGEIVDSWMKLVKKPDSKAIEMLIERLDGKVPSELAIKGLIVHVGDEYAKLALEMNQKLINESTIKYLEGGNDAIQE